jgi:uncharacterized protein YjiS (DUF1127 family)
MSFVFEERRGPLFTQRFADPVQAFRGWLRRRRTFEELTRLDDRLLADIGVTRSDIAGIASRR